MLIVFPVDVDGVAWAGIENENGDVIIAYEDGSVVIGNAEYGIEIYGDWTLEASE